MYFALKSLRTRRRPSWELLLRVCEAVSIARRRLHRARSAMAVARAAFERRWDDAKIAEFASRTKETPPRPLISPALCSDLRPRNASRESARLS